MIEPLPLAHVRPPRILVVEDEFLVALQTEEMLGELGCVVVGPAVRFEQAEAMARVEAIDAAIMDVNLRGIEIYPIAAVLADRAIPFAFATGFSSEGIAPAFRGRPCLQKPFQIEQLRIVLDRLLGAA